MVDRANAREAVVIVDLIGRKISLLLLLLLSVLACRDNLQAAV